MQGVAVKLLREGIKCPPPTAPAAHGNGTRARADGPHLDVSATLSTRSHGNSTLSRVAHVCCPCPPPSAPAATATDWLEAFHSCLPQCPPPSAPAADRKSTRLNSSHL